MHIGHPPERRRAAARLTLSALALLASACAPPPPVAATPTETERADAERCSRRERIATAVTTGDYSTVCLDAQRTVALGLATPKLAHACAAMASADNALAEHAAEQGLETALLGLPSTARSALEARLRAQREQLVSGLTPVLEERANRRKRWACEPGEKLDTRIAAASTAKLVTSDLADEEECRRRRATLASALERADYVAASGLLPGTMTAGAGQKLKALATWSKRPSQPFPPQTLARPALGVALANWPSLQRALAVALKGTPAEPGTRKDLAELVDASRLAQGGDPAVSQIDCPPPAAEPPSSPHVAVCDARQLRTLRQDVPMAVRDGELGRAQELLATASTTLRAKEPKAMAALALSIETERARLRSSLISTLAGAATPTAIATALRRIAGSELPSERERGLAAALLATSFSGEECGVDGVQPQPADASSLEKALLARQARSALACIDKLEKSVPVGAMHALTAMAASAPSAIVATRLAKMLEARDKAVTMLAKRYEERDELGQLLLMLDLPDLLDRALRDKLVAKHPWTERLLQPDCPAGTVVFSADVPAALRSRIAAKLALSAVTTAPTDTRTKAVMPHLQVSFVDAPTVSAAAIAGVTFHEATHVTGTRQEENPEWLACKAEQEATLAAVESAAADDAAAAANAQNCKRIADDGASAAGKAVGGSYGDLVSTIGRSAGTVGCADAGGRASRARADGHLAGARCAGIKRFVEREVSATERIRVEEWRQSVMIDWTLTTDVRGGLPIVWKRGVELVDSDTSSPGLVGAEPADPLTLLAPSELRRRGRLLAVANAMEVFETDALAQVAASFDGAQGKGVTTTERMARQAIFVARAGGSASALRNAVVHAIVGDYNAVRATGR